MCPVNKIYSVRPSCVWTIRSINRAFLPSTDARGVLFIVLDSEINLAGLSVPAAHLWSSEKPVTPVLWK